MHSLKDRLTDILINQKILTDDQLKKALLVQKKKGGSLKNILVELGFVDERVLVSVLSQGLGIPPISLSRFKIDQELVKLIPRDLAKKYQIIPVSKVGDTLTIAMADPLNVFAIDEVKTVTGLEIGTIIASERELDSSIDQYYGETTHQAIEDLLEDMKSHDIEIIKTEVEEEKELRADELFKLVEEVPVVKLTNMVLENAIAQKASDILIEPMEESVRVRYRIDGVLKEVERLPKDMHSSIVSRIKVISSLNIAERRLPQDGRFKLKAQNNEVDFRVSILPSSGGEKVALRVLDRSLALLDIDKLGFQKDAVELLKKYALRPHGMILVCGPTGSGKTTTLYALLKYGLTPEKNLITVEDPVEYQIKGVNQVTVKSEVGLTFQAALRSILRQDPDEIMIGEIRDFETVDIAIKAALTGHLVLSTLHTTTASGSITRLINMGVEPFLISASLIAIVAQRLIRKLCPRCKERYEPIDTIIEKLGIDLKENKKIYFYKAKGCKDCFNMGYSGRFSICEVLFVSPAIKSLVLKKTHQNQLKQVARGEGMRTLREDGLLRVLDGTTSLEEVLRVTVADE